MLYPFKKERACMFEMYERSEGHLLGWKNDAAIEFCGSPLIRKMYERTGEHPVQIKDYSILAVK
jgi:hypothetical protein